jgi:hypothetical protein
MGRGVVSGILCAALAVVAPPACGSADSARWPKLHGSPWSREAYSDSGLGHL